MRVPLPGRDYFPPRVLLRGVAKAAMEPSRPETQAALLSLSSLPKALPASPPAPMASLRPAAA